MASSPQRIVVVGRGLAGALVAWRFMQRGCRVEWWGDGTHSASRVAAGMFNPVSFRRVVEVWNAGAHMSAMRQTLRELEDALGLNLLHDVPVAKVFANEDYRSTWDDRWPQQHGVCQWASRGEELAEAGIEVLQGPSGVGRVHASGWVDVPALLDGMERHFSDQGLLQDRTWSVKDGLPEGADAVVDCRGVGAAEELAQVGVTVNANHGDVLTLSTPLTGPGALDTAGHTVNNGKWLLPTEVKEGKQWWRLGATYSWHRMKPTPQCPGCGRAARPHDKGLGRGGRRGLALGTVGGASSGSATGIPGSPSDGGTVAGSAQGNPDAQWVGDTRRLGGSCHGNAPRELVAGRGEFAPRSPSIPLQIGAPKRARFPRLRCS